MKINSDVIIQKIGGKLTVFDANHSVMFTLNKTAEIIFNKLKSGWTAEKIAGFLAEKFSVSKETSKRDTLALIQTLEKKGILRR